ncbi:exoribonuclease II [Haemophilus influenzae 22.1-21]|nr:exoribonuclease II [Haemophilus influenzae 22.1-21]
MTQQAKSVKEELQEGDWVVANLKTHPLRDDRFSTPQLISLFAELTMN